MKRLLSLVLMVMFAAGFTTHAYNCPTNLYFYESEKSSTEFTKNQTVFTYTVDATQGDVYGVIVNYNATSWDDAQTHNGYFANGQFGNITVNSAETWSTVAEWTGSANNKWSNGCYKFVSGNKYIITLTHANGTFTGSVTIDNGQGEGGEEGEEEGGEEGGDQTESDFDTKKDYYIEASACTWFFDGDAIIKVWDGQTDVPCEKVTGTIIKFRPTATGTNGLMYIKRVDPNNEETVWNEYALSAPTDATHNMFTLNSSFSGGTWGAYATPDAWVISKNINNWSADAKSDYIFDYNETTGIYTLSVPADKLRCENAEDNGFKIGYGALNDWDNYYGAAIENKVLGKGVEAVAVKNGKNFIIPTAATTPINLTFDPKAGKLTADWNVVVNPDDPNNPVDSDDVLVVNLPKMEVNDGEITVEVTLNAAADKNYCSAQWDIEVPAGFTVSKVILNKENCTDHELITNDINGVTKCVVYSAKNTPFVHANSPLFSIKLAAANATVGTAQGKISNILFNVVPVDGNKNITSKFADASFDITVVKAVKTLTADPANLALSNGESKTIAITVEPADATDKTYSWEIVSGENVITLAEDGTVTAKAFGVATIKVTANDGFGAYTTIDVTVDGKKVESITLSATEHTMYVGETTTLTATVTPDDATNKGVMWISSDDNIATVSEGVVTGVSAGEATIYAIAKDGSNVQVSCAITIKAKVSGDADGDDTLTIADIVIIAKKVVGIETEGALEENMDMDGDGNITSADVTLAVYYLNLQNPQNSIDKAQLTTNKLNVSDGMIASDGTVNVALSLENATNVAGLQFDIELPEGIQLTTDSYVAPEANNGHSISINEIGDNTYRVIIFSAYNFKSNKIANLTLSKRQNMTETTIALRNAVCSNGQNLLAVPDMSRNLPFVTGVDSIFVDGNARYDIYSTTGILVAPAADKNVVKQLPAGIYVVGNQKVAVF